MLSSLWQLWCALPLAADLINPPTSVAQRRSKVSSASGAGCLCLLSTGFRFTQQLAFEGFFSPPSSLIIRKKNALFIKGAIKTMSQPCSKKHLIRTYIHLCVRNRVEEWNNEVMQKHSINPTNWDIFTDLLWIMEGSRCLSWRHKPRGSLYDQRSRLLGRGWH